MNAEILLPLDEMTVAEKLAVIDAVWTDLRQNSEHLPVPEWHRQILEDRRKAFERGEFDYSDWEDVKTELRRSMS